MRKRERERGGGVKRMCVCTSVKKRGGERKCVRERVCKKKSVRVYASEIMSARFK